MVRCGKSFGDSKYNFYTKATDYWSLGIVAFGMFSKHGTHGVFREDKRLGKKDLRDNNFDKKAAEDDKQGDILNKQPLLDKVSCPMAREFVKKCLQKEVIHRVTNFNEASKYEIFKDIIWDDMFARKSKPPVTVLEMQCKPKHDKPMAYIDGFNWSSPDVDTAPKDAGKDPEPSKLTTEKAVQTSPITSTAREGQEDVQEEYYVPKKISRTSPVLEAIKIVNHTALNSDDEPRDEPGSLIERLITLRDDFRQTGEEIDELLMNTSDKQDDENKQAEPVKASTLAQVTEKGSKPDKVKKNKQKLNRDTKTLPKTNSRAPTYENILGRIKGFLESNSLENYTKDFQLISKQCNEKQLFYFKCSLCEPKRAIKVQGKFSKGLILVRVSGNGFDISAVKRHVKDTHKVATSETGKQTLSDTPGDTELTEEDKGEEM